MNSYYHIIDFNKGKGIYEISILPEEGELFNEEFGVIKAEWSRDIEDHFAALGFEFVESFDIEDRDGDPITMADYEATCEILEEEGFSLESLNYIVITKKETWDDLYNQINALFHEKKEMMN